MLTQGLAAFLSDLRYGTRLLLRSPGFSAVAIAALALGIGANTAIFSVVNTLLIQRLPYHEPERLAIVWEHNLPRDRKNNVVSPGNFIHWREMNQVFDDIAAVGLTFNLTLTGHGEPVELPFQYVTPPFFSILGVPPALGRPFTAEEAGPNSRVVVISDRLWRTRLGADPEILARGVTLQGVSHSVVGVMPPGFALLDKTVDVWLPAPFTAESRTPRGRWLATVARLKPGVTFEQAQRDMTRVAGELTKLFPDFNTGWTARVVPLREQLTGDIRPALLVLLAAVACVLLIACANVANLLLARATARGRELAVRAALGAGRRRLIRQLLAESLVLSLAGGAAGIALAWWGLGLLRAFVADRIPVYGLESIGINGTVLAFTAGASILSGLFFGLVPAFSAAGASLNDSLKEGGRTGSAARGKRARAAFVVVEIALALVLLVGAGLLVRSFAHLMAVDTGFDTSRTITMRVSVPQSRYGEPARRVQFFDRLLERVRLLPGVEASGAISFLPLAGLGAATGFEVVGAPPPPAGEGPVTDVRVIADGYFKAMRVPLVRGRLFDEGQPADAQNKVIVNETLARRHWPNEDPIGRRIKVSWDDNREDEIIGVVGDVRQADLETEPRGTIYWPHARTPYGSMTLTLRTAGEPAAITSSVRDTLRELDPNLALADVKSMREVVSRSVAQRRLTMVLLGIFAAAALLLAAVGIYGVLAYSVTQRTQEIGIRLALGAQRGDVLKMIVAEAAVLAGAGIVLGAAGAALLTRLMTGLLFGVQPFDPVTFAVVALVLAGIALLASYLPGRRATRVDPVIALRAE
jgi:putative ABC transport system permease protein